MLDSVAAGWNTNRAELELPASPRRRFTWSRLTASSTTAARHSESSLPPRSLRPGQIACGGTRSPSTPPNKVGFGEYTYRGQRNYHGVVVLHLDGGLDPELEGIPVWITAHVGRVCWPEPLMGTFAAVAAAYPRMQPTGRPEGPQLMRMSLDRSRAWE